MIQKFGAKTLDRFAALAMTNQQLIAWVHGEERSDAALRRHGCQSEHSRSEWPEGQIADAICSPVSSFDAPLDWRKIKMDSRFRGNDELGTTDDVVP